MTKILIVEDEEAISNLIRMSLCKTGYICEQAFDGETAADLIAENSYDLILLDQSHTNMRAWLYTVARNLYYNEVSKNRRVMYVDEYENETEDRANIPLENILSKERNRLLYHAIEHLPERQREIVMMQYFGGLGQKEIAKVLHMTPENVRVSAHRAKKQMKNYMEGQGSEL